MKFRLGQVVVTRGVNNLIVEDNNFAKFVERSFHRYVTCDWGEMCEDDKNLNDNAIKTGEDRIFAAYKNSNYKIYIITEWDQSATTILFPSEY